MMKCDMPTAMATARHATMIALSSTTGTSLVIGNTRPRRSTQHKNRSPSRVFLLGSLPLFFHLVLSSTEKGIVHFRNHLIGHFSRSMGRCIHGRYTTTQRHAKVLVPPPFLRTGSGQDEMYCLSLLEYYGHTVLGGVGGICIGSKSTSSLYDTEGA